MKIHWSKSLPIIGLILLSWTPITLVVTSHTRTVQYEGMNISKKLGDEHWQRIYFWQTFRGFVQDALPLSWIVIMCIGVTSIIFSKGKWKLVGLANILAVLILAWWSFRNYT